MLKTFCINGKQVKELYINGNKVNIGEVAIDYLCFEALSDGATVKIVKVGNPSTHNFDFSLDGVDWDEYTIGTVITLANVGDKIYFRSTDEEMSSSTTDYYNFVMTGQIKGSGDLLSIVNNFNELKGNVFVSLFENCTSLIEAPYISPCRINTNSMRAMFKGCSNLTKVQDTIENLETSGSGSASGMRQMFYGCSSLETPPVIVKTNKVSISPNEFREMFYNCTGLDVIEDATENVFFDLTTYSEDGGDGRSNMFYNVGSSVNPTPQFGKKYGYFKAPDCLCFTANTSGSTVKMVRFYGPSVQLQYSTDGKNWSPFIVNSDETSTDGTTVTLNNVGDKVWIKAIGSNQRMAYDDDTYNRFVMTGSIAASGNVNSLLEEDEETARTMSFDGRDLLFSFLFSQCSSLTQAPELPSTELSRGCYWYMFTNCSSLTQAPELPSTELAEMCYTGMFRDCSSLTTAPQLPTTTTIPSRCYEYMFDGCRSLKISDTPVSGGVKFLDIPSDATAEWWWNENTFTRTGGTYTSDPQVGHAYYYYNDQPSRMMMSSGRPEQKITNSDGLD